ncbi:hypothetical protein CWB58_09925 [Pseudoalteromonas sp. S201]|nr:hypothetical protein CWB58_09925 [Pseudoalteromonas sp. S201]
MILVLFFMFLSFFRWCYLYFILVKLNRNRVTAIRIELVILLAQVYVAVCFENSTYFLSGAGFAFVLIAMIESMVLRKKSLD